MEYGERARRETALRVLPYTPYIASELRGWKNALIMQFQDSGQTTRAASACHNLVPISAAPFSIFEAILYHSSMAQSYHCPRFELVGCSS